MREDLKIPMSDEDLIVYRILYHLNRYRTDTTRNEIIENQLKEFSKEEVRRILEDVVLKLYAGDNGKELVINRLGEIRFNDLQSEIDREANSKIQSNVEAMGRTTLTLTWVLAVAALISAICYVIEISHLFCH